jgi:hypothetical protein
MNYSNFYPPVTRRIRQLFLLSYLLAYWWSEVIDKNLIHQITVQFSQNHLTSIVLVKSVFLTVSLQW